MPAEDYLHSNGLLGWVARWSGDYTRDTHTPPSLSSAGYTGNGLLMKLAGNDDDKVGYSVPTLTFTPPPYAANSNSSEDDSFTGYSSSAGSNTRIAVPDVFSGDTILDRPVELMNEKSLQLSVHMGSDWVQHIAAKELTRRAAMRYLSDAPFQQTLDHYSDADNAAYGEPPPLTDMQPAATPTPADAGVLLSGDSEPSSDSEQKPDLAAPSSEDRNVAEPSYIAAYQAGGALADDNPTPSSETGVASDIAGPDIRDGAAEAGAGRKTAERSGMNGGSLGLVPSGGTRGGERTMADLYTEKFGGTTSDGVYRSQEDVGQLEYARSKPVATSKPILDYIGNEYIKFVAGLDALKGGNATLIEQSRVAAAMRRAHYTDVTGKMTDFLNNGGALSGTDSHTIQILEADLGRRLQAFSIPEAPSRYERGSSSIDPGGKGAWTVERTRSADDFVQDVGAIFSHPASGAVGFAKAPVSLAANMLNFASDAYGRAYYGAKYLTTRDSSAYSMLTAPSMQAIDGPRYYSSAERGGAHVFNVGLFAAPIALRAIDRLATEVAGAADLRGIDIGAPQRSVSKLTPAQQLALVGRRVPPNPDAAAVVASGEGADTVSLFRKMSIAEAEPTLSTMKLQSSISGTNSSKYLSESKGKVADFQNNGVLGVPQTTLEFVLDKAGYDAMMRSSVNQAGSKGISSVKVNFEGIDPASSFRNIGVPPSRIDLFNALIKDIKPISE